MGNFVRNDPDNICFDMPYLSHFRPSIPLLHSLAARFTLGIALLALALIGLTATLSQREFSQRLEAAEQRTLVGAVHGLAEHLRADVLEHLQNNALVFATLPSLQDLADNPASPALRQGVVRDYVSLLRANPNYSLAHLISIRQPGREILRVSQDMVTQSIKVGADGTAHGLADTPHFRLGRGLAPGQVYLTSIELKREDGQLLEPYQPVLHAITPVHDSRGQIFAVLVLQLDLRNVIRNLRTGLRDKQSLYMFDADGYCLTAPRTTSCSFGFEFPGNAAEPELASLLPNLAREIDRQTADAFSVRDLEKGQLDVVTGVVLLPFDNAKTARRLTLVVTAPYASAQASAAAGRATLKPMLLVVALATIVLSLLAANTLTAPLRHMTASVKAFAEEGRDLPLPTDDKNEIGLLARAFARMRDDVRTRASLEADNRAKEILVAARMAAERDAQEARALAALLRQSLQPTALKDYLQASLDTLLTTIPWLAILPRGGFFLEKVGAGETAGSLRLAAHHNLSPELLNLGEPVTHGHFNLPILHGGKLLGALVLYLPHDYREEGGEREFLTQVADVLAIGIAARHTQAELEDARIRAEAAAHAKSKFLDTMSHEIRTPLNGILGMAQILQQTPLSQEQGEFVQTIRQSGNALLNILNDILDFSKLEAGRFELDPIEFDLEHTIIDAARLMAARAEEKGLELLVLYAPDCPHRVTGDAGRIRQILLNLMDNAVKFTQQGHIELSAAYAGQDENGQPRLRIAVRDTGIGISQEGLTRVFQSFSQADASHTRKFGGTGIGLAISKQLVDLMGGEIGVESEPDVGSTFWFILPLQANSTSGTTAETQEAGADKTAVSPVFPATATEAHIDRKPLDVFRSQFGDDFAMLLDTFMETTPPLFDEMSVALAAGEKDVVRRHAHSLKSSAATYGAMQLSTMARAFESEAAAGNLTHADVAIAALQAEYAAVVKELEAYRNS